MRFLEHRGNHIGIKTGLLHDLSVRELVSLRDAITAFRKMLKLHAEGLSEVLDLFVTHPDYVTLRMNKNMIPEILEALNGEIARRNTAKPSDICKGM